jgi:uncharacterized protein
VNDLVELDRVECYGYLRSVPVGRIAVVVGGMPEVRPVNFAVFDEDVIVRTGAGVLVGATLGAGLAAFEADGFDLGTRSGWSVLVQGRLREVVRQDELALVATLGLDPWVPGAKGHLLRLHPSHVSGRRLAEPRPVRRPTVPDFGPDTPVSSLPLRPLPPIPPGLTIADALRFLYAASSPVGSLDPRTSRFVGTVGLVRALVGGVSEFTPAHMVAGDDILVLPSFTGLLEAVRMMSARDVSHAVVQKEHGGQFGVLTVGDAVSPLLWVFDPVVLLLRCREAIDVGGLS